MDGWGKESAGLKDISHQEGDLPETGAEKLPDPGHNPGHDGVPYCFFGPIYSHFLHHTRLYYICAIDTVLLNFDHNHNIMKNPRFIV